MPIPLKQFTVSKNRNNNKQKKQYKTLLSVLAEASSDKANDLLEKITGKRASSVEELEQKLGQAYSVSERKVDIEKEMADIHPHKDFILKYNKPKEPVKVEEVDKTEDEMAIDKSLERLPNTNMVVAHDGYANFEGHAPCGNPNCKKCSRYFSNANGYSNACGCSGADGGYSNCSGADGSQTSSGASNTTLMVVGIVSIVAILGMVLTLQKNK